MRRTTIAVLTASLFGLGSIQAESPAVVAPKALPEHIPLPSEAWTLATLAQRAEQVHPALELARQEIDAAQGRAVQAGLYPNPSVGTSSPQLNGTQGQNVLVTQEIVTPGKLRLSQAAVSQEVEQARFRYQAMRLQIVAAVRREFFTTVAMQRRVALQTDLTGLVLRSRDTAQLLLESGEGTKADVLLFDIDYDRAVMATQTSRTDLEVARKRLAFAVGEPALPIGQLEGSLEIAIPEANLETLRELVAATHPDMGIATAEADRSQVLLRRARLQPAPNVEAMIQNQGLFQLMVAVPLFDRNQGNIRAAQAELARAKAGIRAAELDLSQRTAQAYNNFTVAAQQVHVYQRQLRPKAQQTFQISRALYEQGQSDFLRLLQSQRTLIETELGYLDAQEARLLAAADLAALVQWHDFPNSPPPRPQ